MLTECKIAGLYLVHSLYSLCTEQESVHAINSYRDVFFLNELVCLLHYGYVDYIAACLGSMDLIGKTVQLSAVVFCVKYFLLKCLCISFLV